MPKQPQTLSGINNFLKVTAKAVTRPTRILAGALAVAAALLVPQISIPVLLGGGAAIIAMSWADINDPEFIKKALVPDALTTPNYASRIDGLISELKNKLANTSLFPEVSIDVTATIETLIKIKNVIANLPQDDQGSVAFVIDQIVKLVKRLEILLDKEELARQFLHNEDKHHLENEMSNLQSSLERIDDQIAKQQIQKVIKQKIEQIGDYKQVESRLARIDAYIANIREALYSTYSNLTKLQLKDEFSLVDDADVLTQSMRQIVDEIDAFAEKGLDLGVTADQQPTKQPKRQKAAA